MYNLDELLQVDEIGHMSGWMGAELGLRPRADHRKNGAEHGKKGAELKKREAEHGEKGGVHGYMGAEALPPKIHA